MSETITSIPILDSQTDFLTFQVRVGGLAVTIERSETGLWLRLPSLTEFNICVDLWHMLPQDPADHFEQQRHGLPQVLLYSGAEADSDDPIVRAIFSPQKTELYTGDAAP